jgi:hypothetical protein
MPAPPLCLADAELVLIPIGIVALAVMFVVLLLVIRSVLRTREIERTRREVAAYVAEGSISPDDVEKILGKQEPPAGDFEKKLGNAVSWGQISPAKAESLIKVYRSRSD